MAKKKKRPMDNVELLDELEYYERPKRGRGINPKFIIGFLLLVIIISGILFSPLFAVKEIRSEGVEHFTTTELAEMISLSPGENLIFFGKSKAIEILEQDPYIAQASLKKELPDTMVIQIKERKVRGYVPYMGAYLYIDEEGRVLETQNAFHEALPVVRGLKFDSFILGEVLPAENKDSLQVVLQMSQMMKKYDLLDMVVEIDVTDPKDTYAYVNKVEIRLGDMKDSDQKVRIMGEIMRTIPKEDRGTLDLRDLSKPIIFQYLT
ncbi:cell division protein FtsQ/DivIB [Anaerotignum sp. MB30-C6]|uniref:cell division protein FtsQ/DivIB n=1 Tax=Anaerotignum sp. MB30-C6 TaxID=3070814 RepID=UPI0027DE4FF3|nr:FtsQ-type POTRA domain-containing protein [Anaerotignum sp. MB30-C6]WMI80281.1 FtsQ-type POTRA domain-containing protein [Anaerotignum sp. MB30-C6]